MLDIKVIRKQPELVRDIIKKRNLSLNLDDFLDIDKQKLDLIIKVDELRALKNKVSKEIPSMSNDKKPEKIKEMKKLGEKLDTFELEQKEIEQKWEALYYQIPNILDKTAAI
jgi:seryl-tRNA synthetase